jgi:predicted O-methyltransferase YrrM
MFDADEGVRWGKAALDFGRSRARLDGVLKSLGIPAFNPAKDSIHWVLAAAIEQRFSPKRILEIGTFKGQFTAILSRLYPEAEIVTVDLPESDPLLREMYGRKKSATLEREMAQRTANLNTGNIHQVKCNSFFLLDVVQGPFDIIWVDAGHRFPDVAWDLCNAFHLVRPGGIVMADDVTLDPALSTSTLGPDTEIVLRYVADRTEAPIYYFLKRRNEAIFLDPKKKKFVAWCEKPATWPGSVCRDQRQMLSSDRLLGTAAITR